MTPETWDSMIPHFLQNVSPAGREFLRRATQSAQPTSQFFSIGAGQLEGWTLRFLASLADTPRWENTVSLVNGHRQTLAHLAVLFRYTTLLKQVAHWGIDVDVQDVNGFTALHCAYLCGDLDSVEVLRGYGADEDIQDNLGRRPLDMYTPSTNDLSSGSPSSDRTSSSSQRPTTGEEDWERVSMASSQPGSFSDHETTTGLPASRHQPLHTRDLTTSSSVIPTSLSMPSPAGGSSFLTGDWELIKGVGGRSLSSPENTPSFSHVPDVSVVSFRYVRSQEQELKGKKETLNESNWQYNQDIQSPSSLQGAIPKPQRDSLSEGGDRDSPGEYERCKNDSIDSIYSIYSVATDPFTQCFCLYPGPKASGASSLSLSFPAEHRSSTQEQNSHPQSIISFSHLDLTAVEADNQGAPPVLANIEHRVGALLNVVEEHSSRQKMDVDSPNIRGHGQFQVYFNNRPASHPILPSVTSISHSRPDLIALEQYYSSSVTHKEVLKQIKELKELEKNLNESVWLLHHLHEPLVGDSDCHYLAEKYGKCRASCYTAFVQDNEDDTYGCRHEKCRGFQTDSLEDAITHQRKQHFDHRPFECIPLSGTLW